MPNAGDPKTLVDAFLKHAAATPARVAFVCGDDQITWSTSGARIAAIASGLKGHGLRRGMRVLMVARNRPDTACAYLAIHAAGGVAALIDDRSTPSDIRARQSALDARFVIAEDACLPPESGVEVLSIAALAASEVPSASFEPLCRAEDPADILFTSGSTGQPKAVVLSHAAILTAARQITAVIGQTSEDLELVLVPLGHSFGLGRLRCMALTGHSLVLEPDLRDPVRALLRMLQLKVSGLAQVPAGFEMMRLLGRDRLGGAAPHLRYVEIGSAPMRQETRAWLTRLLPQTGLYHHYGMTEASRAVFTEFHRDRDRQDSIGQPAPGVEVMITDASGNAVAPGIEGEIAIRGGMLMQGYLGEEPLSPGMAFRSGDRGWRDEDGYLHLSGRVKDIINVGGLKVMPLEVETALDELGAVSHLGIEDFAILGVADPAGVTGETVAFAYAGEQDVPSSDVRRILVDRLAAYKVPTCSIRLQAIPRAGNGKVLGAQLRELVSQQFAARSVPRGP